MNNLKKTIENTLINNLETDRYACIELESIERCSDYIAQEIKEVAVAFSLYKAEQQAEFDNGTENRKPLLTYEQLFEEFIADRYREEDK